MNPGMERGAAAAAGEEELAMELYDVPFADLLRLSSSDDDDDPQLQCISASIMHALGPSGPGLLSVSALPLASSLRRSLLPLALPLSLLPPRDRAPLLKKYGLGTDVPLKKPDRTVSSFTSLLTYSPLSLLHQPQPQDINVSGGGGGGCCTGDAISHSFSLNELNEGHFDHLADAFKNLGRCMMELGLCLARVCDNALHTTELEESIVHAGSAKGRLIHYHSKLDALVLKQMTQKGISSQKFTVFNDMCKEKSAAADLWQQWHYDYGIFTVLTSPLFLSSALEGETVVSRESPDVMGHSCLQLFDTRKKKVVSVKCRPDSFIIQVGEAADVLSGGRLRSTLHAVTRPLGIGGDVSRETFVVFLQPSWDKVLHYRGCSFNHPEEEVHDGDELADIRSKIPPLSARLRDGMTFAEFSRETTKQYYGGSGTQNKC